MANSTVDFLEILLAETHVDIDKLRSAARYGVPDEIRGEVWKYLLGVEGLDKTNEISNRQAKYDEYRKFERDNSEIMKRVRGEVSRYYRARVKVFKARDPTSALENVISSYLSHHRAVEYSPEM
ncbi:hypothetical protein HDU76_013205, partial [Blyttiomyces sp. JEL0837]